MTLCLSLDGILAQTKLILFVSVIILFKSITALYKSSALKNGQSLTVMIIKMIY